MVLWIERCTSYTLSVVIQGLRGTKIAPNLGTFQKVIQMGYRC